MNFGGPFPPKPFHDSVIFAITASSELWQLQQQLRLLLSLLLLLLLSLCLSLSSSPGSCRLLMQVLLPFCPVCRACSSQEHSAPEHSAPHPPLHSLRCCFQPLQVAFPEGCRPQQFLCSSSPSKPQLGQHPPRCQTISTGVRAQGMLIKAFLFASQGPMGSPWLPLLLCGTG